MKRKLPTHVVAVLFLLYTTGIFFNTFIVLDAAFLSVMIHPPRLRHLNAGGEELRQSVLFVVSQGCSESGGSTGTAFVVGGEYLATAAHVVAEPEQCGTAIRVVDFERRERSAQVVAFSEEDDVALLRVEGLTLPPLKLARSRDYYHTSSPIGVYTFGYPLPGAGSTATEAAFSGQGNISQYRPDLNRFVTSNLNLNPGNSGGPVLLVDRLEVLAVASARLKQEVGDGIGYAVPEDVIRTLYRKVTSGELP